MQKSVECMDQDCRGKPPHERLMKYSGHASFEAHCGKNPKQQHWRNSFKVDVEGTATLVQSCGISPYKGCYSAGFWLSFCAVPGCMEKELLKSVLYPWSAFLVCKGHMLSESIVVLGSSTACCLAGVSVLHLTDHTPSAIAQLT